MKGEWQTKEQKLKPYQEYLSSLLGNFEEIKFTHLGRERNHFVDALATLAAMAVVTQFWIHQVFLKCYFISKNPKK